MDRLMSFRLGTGLSISKTDITALVAQVRRSAANYHQLMANRGAPHHHQHHADHLPKHTFMTCNSLECRAAAEIVAKYEPMCETYQQPGPIRKPFNKRDLRKVNIGMEAYIDAH